MKHILKCGNCGSYGLKEKCGCGERRIETKPPKYSSSDKYGEYRRKAKESLKAEGNDSDEME